MTNDLTMPALFTVLVGDDPVRRVATCTREDNWRVFSDNAWWWHATETVHDVVEVIPEGTPIENVVVVGHGGWTKKWLATCDRCGTHTGKSCGTAEESEEVMRAAGWTAYRGGMNACQDCSPVIAAVLAARAAEPTPEETKTSETPVHRLTQIGYTDEYACTCHGRFHKRDCDDHLAGTTPLDTARDEYLALVMEDDATPAQQTPATEPTPDPLAQARERLEGHLSTVRPDAPMGAFVAVAVEDLRDLLAATEGGASRPPYPSGPPPGPPSPPRAPHDRPVA